MRAGNLARRGPPDCQTCPSHYAAGSVRAISLRGSGPGGEPRLWWQDVLPSDWTAFSLPDDLVRERYTALLAALEELSTRGPMSTLVDILAQLRTVGFHDPLTEADYGTP